MSNLVNYVKSCQIMSFMSNHAIHDFSRNSVKSGGQGRAGREGGGQIGLPKPSATASLSGRRQKENIKVIIIVTLQSRITAGADKLTYNKKKLFSYTCSLPTCVSSSYIYLALKLTKC
jgi:hypothetical protein